MNAHDRLKSILLAGVVALAQLSPQNPALAAEDARVLPAGRYRLGTLYARSASISQTFNNDGKEESVTSAYNLDLDSHSLRNFNSGFDKLVNGLNAFGFRYNPDHSPDDPRYGFTDDPSMPLVGDALKLGHLGPEAEARREQYLLSFQYGVTDRISVGFLAPYLHTRVNVTQSITGKNTADDISRGLGTRALTTDLDGLLTLLRTVNPETFQKILTDRGYARFENWDRTGFGDLVLGSRFKYLDLPRTQSRHGELLQSLQLGITVPTGWQHGPGELTAVDFGQGVWDFNLAHVANWSPTPLLMLSQGLHYTHRLPGRRSMRVRKDENDFFPDSSGDEVVRSQLGDKAWASAGAKLSFTDWLSTDCGYEWYWKGKDVYQGDRGRDYASLSALTGGYTETAQIGLSVSTLGWFMRGAFPVPGDLQVNVYVPTRGRNSLIAAYGTAEFNLYF